jgi:hypothetical protein
LRKVGGDGTVASNGQPFTHRISWDAVMVLLELTEGQTKKEQKS